MAGKRARGGSWLLGKKTAYVGGMGHCKICGRRGNIDHVRGVCLKVKNCKPYAGGK